MANRTFTHREDSAGLADGLNLYGFANGDPVNFSDPFGLYCTDKDGNRDPCQVSEAGTRFIADHEGFSSTLYTDVAGNAAIGLGHLIRLGEELESPTDTEGFALIKTDLATGVLPSLGAVEIELSQNQVDALAGFTYNVGSGASESSTLLTNLKGGIRDGADTAPRRTEWTTGRTDADPQRIPTESPRECFLRLQGKVLRIQMSVGAANPHDCIDPTYREGRG